MAKQIAVIGPSHPSEQEAVEAYRIGQLLAEHGTGDVQGRAERARVRAGN